MNCCRFSVVWMLAWTTVAAGLTAAQAQQAFPSGGRKIEFSDPGASTATSNLNAIANERTAFPNLENDLKKSFEAFQSGGSLQGIGAPGIQRAPSPAPSSRKLKELLERRQEWQFLEPEDYHSEQTIEEILGIPEYGPNGEVKEKKSPLERYFERLERGNTGATNRTRNDGPFGMGAGKRNDGTSRDPNLNLSGTQDEPGAMREMDDPLKQLLRGNAGTALFPDSTKPISFSDLFGQSGPWNSDPTETSRTQAARLEELKRIWDSRSSPSLPSASPIFGIAPYDLLKPSPSTTPRFGLPRGIEPVPVVPVATVTPVGDSLSPFSTAADARPPELPEVTTSLPGLTPSAPLPEPVRTSVPATDFNIPKRRF